MLLNGYHTLLLRKSYRTVPFKAQNNHYQLMVGLTGKQMRTDTIARAPAHSTNDIGDFQHYLHVCFGTGSRTLSLKRTVDVFIEMCIDIVDLMQRTTAQKCVERPS